MTEPPDASQTSRSLPESDEKQTPAVTNQNVLAWLMRQNYIDSTDLFGGEQEVLIKHNEVMYRLQITKLDKLILTK